MAQGGWKSTTRLVEQAKQILLEQWPMTLRQLFYQLVCVVAIENSTRDYQRLRADAEITVLQQSFLDH